MMSAKPLGKKRPPRTPLPTLTHEQRVEQYIKTHSKSAGFGVLLTLLMGPIGLAYSHCGGAFILTACVGIAFSLHPGFAGIVAIGAWGASILISILAMERYHDQVRARAALFYPPPPAAPLALEAELSDSSGNPL